jgi:5-methyltetrahydrofolate--homocysteine methyltransferase
MDFTESFQLLPEQSTAAIIIHHPEAKYYAVRGVSDSAEMDRKERAETALAAARSDT